MITATQNQPSFKAKLTKNAIGIIKENKTSINAQTKRALRTLRQDLNTNTATVDIVKQKRRGKDVFSFSINPDPKSVAKLTPHHPVFIRDDKNPTGLKIRPKRTFFWKSLDEMFQNDLLKPEKLKKLIDTWNERGSNLNKWLKAKPDDSKTYEHSGKTGQKTAELITLMTIK